MGSELEEINERPDEGVQLEGEVRRLSHQCTEVEEWSDTAKRVQNSIAPVSHDAGEKKDGSAENFEQDDSEQSNGRKTVNFCPPPRTSTKKVRQQFQERK